MLSVLRRKPSQQRRSQPVMLAIIKLHASTRPLRRTIQAGNGASDWEHRFVTGQHVVVWPMFAIMLHYV